MVAKDWYSAAEYCSEHFPNGRLAVIRNYDDQAKLHDFIVEHSQ